MHRCSGSGGNDEERATRKPMRKEAWHEGMRDCSRKSVAEWGSSEERNMTKDPEEGDRLQCQFMNPMSPDSRQSNKSPSVCLLVRAWTFPSGYRNFLPIRNLVFVTQWQPPRHRRLGDRLLKRIRRCSVCAKTWKGPKIRYPLHHKPYSRDNLPSPPSMLNLW